MRPSEEVIEGGKGIRILWTVLVFEELSLGLN